MRLFNVLGLHTFRTLGRFAPLCACALPYDRYRMFSEFCDYDQPLLYQDKNIKLQIGMRLTFHVHI